MRTKILVVAFLFLSAYAKAQYIYNGGCVDSSLIQPPFSFYCPGSIPPNFDPVCGCDGNTYRTACAAQNLGGLPLGNYQQGICGDFDIDFVPNAIVPSSPLNSYGILSIYVNTASTALIEIFDIYGREWLEQEYSVYVPYPIFSLDIYMDTFPPSMYYVVVIINGQLQERKVIRGNPN